MPVKGVNSSLAGLLYCAFLLYIDRLSDTVKGDTQGEVPGGSGQTHLKGG